MIICKSGRLHSKRQGSGSLQFDDCAALQQGYTAKERHIPLMPRIAVPAALQDE
jgi:hypothetical protein